MRVDPWPNKSSRKESNLRGGISRPARKQGADNGARWPSLRNFVLKLPRIPVCDARARAKSARCEIKSEFKSLNPPLDVRLLPGARGEEASEKNYGRKGGLATSRPSRYDLTVYTPVSPHGATKWKCGKQRAGVVVVSQTIIAFAPFAQRMQDDCACDRLRIARSRSLSIDL